MGIIVPNDIRALIFDLDGVIADTIELHYLSWKRLADEEQIPFTRQDNDRLRGLTRRESLQYFVKDRPLDEETAQAWMQRKGAYFDEFLERFTPANRLPGVTRLLDDARAAGLKIGLGSASKNARAVLSRLELLEVFDVIGDGQSVARHKPAPDIFLWVAERLDVPPDHTLIFEDSTAGVEAALAGGFRVVGIGASSGARAHLTLPSLADISLHELLRRLKDVKVEL